MECIHTYNTEERFVIRQTLYFMMNHAWLYRTQSGTFISETTTDHPLQVAHELRSNNREDDDLVVTIPNLHGKGVRGHLDHMITYKSCKVRQRPNTHLWHKRK